MMNRCLGRHTPIPTPHLPALATYSARAPLPIPPDVVDWTAGLPDWPLLANDRLGDCVPVGIMPARYNKLVRAQKTIRRWNDGDIAVPANAPWASGFLHRVSLFRGHERDRDDEVDALVSVADAMLGGATTSSVRAMGGTKPYQGFLG